MQYYDDEEDLNEDDDDAGSSSTTGDDTGVTGQDMSAGTAMPISDDKITLITKEGLEKLKEELRFLKEVKRKEVAQRLKEAISYGDLSENAEYEESKNEQAFVEGRIMELEEKVKYAKIIDDKNKHGAIVQLGSQVIVQNVTSKGKGEEEFTIVGSTEADPVNHKISNVSPVGKALLDRHVGETVDVLAPAGTIKYKIVKVK